MIRVYTQQQQGSAWLERYRGRSPVFACVLGFTATGLIPGISAAGATPESRRYTCLADAEFLYNGHVPQPQYPLPPLSAGVSPVLISRAVVAACAIPVYLFNAGLPQAPSVPAIDLGGSPARCLTGGDALPLATVKHLLEQGLIWGQQLAASVPDGYLILSECVVGGTTTALSVLTGLGYPAAGKVNSSHPTCNHDQKWGVVQAGLQRAGIIDFGLGTIGVSIPDRDLSKTTPAPTDTIPHSPSPGVFDPNENRYNKQPNNLKPSPTQPYPPLSRGGQGESENLKSIEPLQLVAAVGDPMQVAVAGMAIAASRTCGVLLAGGTQMLAVYALMQAIAHQLALEWQPAQIVVGTTRWVAQDPTGDTVALANAIGSVPLLATELSFAASRYAQLRAYELGYVKEGVGAGGAAIAAHLFQGWNQVQLLQAIEALVDRC